jgi:hypothetical protein
MIKTNSRHSKPGVCFLSRKLGVGIKFPAGLIGISNAIKYVFMNSEFFDMPGDDKQQSTGTTESTGAAQKEAHISPPHNDRPEGPFEHSGETSGWTKEEEEEAEMQDQDQQ